MRRTRVEPWFLWRRLMPFIVLLAACAGPRLATIEGPEAADLVQRITGYIVENGAEREPCGLVILALPRLQTTVLRPSGPAGKAGCVGLQSGPDHEGRIAYVEDHFFDAPERHVLRVVKVDGTEDQEIFTRPRSAGFSGQMWDLALAPTGGRIAFIGPWRVRPSSENIPIADGPIEIWDIATRTGRDTGVVSSLWSRLSWFPDGRRLAYVEFVAAQSVMNDPVTRFDEWASYANWEKVPAVHIFDIASGKREFFYLGEGPLVSVDGETVLVRYDKRGGFAGSQYRAVDVASHTSRPIHWPGEMPVRRPIALLPGDLIIYQGLPTAGLPARWSYGTYPRAMPSLKLAELGTGRFQTLLPYSHHRVSFGSGEAASRR